MPYLRKRCNPLFFPLASFAPPAFSPLLYSPTGDYYNSTMFRTYVASHSLAHHHHHHSFVLRRPFPQFFLAAPSSCGRLLTDLFLSLSSLPFRSLFLSSALETLYLSCRSLSLSRGFTLARSIRRPQVAAINAKTTRWFCGSLFSAL